MFLNLIKENYIVESLKTVCTFVTRSIYWAVRFVWLNEQWHQLVVVRLSTGGSTVSLWPDLIRIRMASESLCHAIWHLKKLWWWVPPVIRIISIYLWYCDNYSGVSFISIVYFKSCYMSVNCSFNDIFLLIDMIPKLISGAVMWLLPAHVGRVSVSPSWKVFFMPLEVKMEYPA